VTAAVIVLDVLIFIGVYALLVVAGALQDLNKKLPMRRESKIDWDAWSAWLQEHGGSTE